MLSVTKQPDIAIQRVKVFEARLEPAAWLLKNLFTSEGSNKRRLHCFQKSNDGMSEVRRAEHRGRSVVRQRCCLQEPPLLLCRFPVQQERRDRRKGPLLQTRNTANAWGRAKRAVPEAARVSNIQAATLVCRLIWWFWHERPVRKHNAAAGSEPKHKHTHKTEKHTPQTPF